MSDSPDQTHPIKQFANPFDRRKGWFWPHLGLILLIIVAIVLAFVLGFLGGVKYSENYYQTHYKAPLRVPHIFTPVHVAPKVRAKADDGGAIHMQYFTSQTDDQGTLGSCEGWAFGKALSYAANWNTQPSGTHWHRFYSPRFFYDAVSNCQDNGSYLEQFPPVVQSLGAVRWKDMPYGSGAESIPNPLPDFAVECPTPQWANALARLAGLGVSETQLFPNQGAGPGGLALIHAQLATHHAVAVDLPVFPEYDRANADGSTVTLPQQGENDRGGHANVDVRSDPTHNNGDGTFGADLFSNQWSKYAGVGPDGIRHSGANNGFVWVSWQFIEQYIWDAAVIHVPKSAPNPTPTPTPTNDPVQRTLQLINQHRAQYNLPALTLNTAQSVNSAGHAQAMAQTGQIWHVNSQYPQYSFPQSIVVPSNASAENVAMAGSADQADSLMWSEPHSAGCSGNHACAMIGSQYRSVGIGVYVSGGQAWVVEDFTDQGTGSTNAPGLRGYVPPQGKTFPPPSKAGRPAASAHAPGAFPIVVGIKTNDTHVDISGAINAAADLYGFSAPGYAALMGVESNINQYAPHYPIGGAGYCDYSAGLTQITVCTAHGLGVGDGSLSQANINYVFWYEQADANRDVALSGKLVNSFHQAVCWDWPELYASWNMGPGYGCFASVYKYPNNPITRQAVANYAGWWNWVWANHVQWVNPPPPPPKPHRRFPVKRWCRDLPRKSCPSPYFHKHAGTVAREWAFNKRAFGKKGTIDHACGGVKTHEEWNARRHVMFQSFKHCWVWSHPTWKGDPTKWKKFN